MYRRAICYSHEVHYQVLGQAEGETYVLIHGIGVTMNYFLPLAEELARRGTVYVVDLPGFGKSPKPDRPLGIEAYADVVRALIDQEQIHRPVLIGHSMGVQIVVEIMRCTPGLARYGVLIGPVVDRHARHAFIQTVRLLQDALYEPWRTKRTVIKDYMRCGISWYLTVLPYMLGYPLEQRIKDVREKLFILRGGRDPIAPLPWAKELAERARDGELQVLPGAHNFMHMHPVAVVDACMEKMDG